MYTVTIVFCTGYRLVVICSKEDEQKSRIISRLHLHKRPVEPMLSESQGRKYLKGHFVLVNNLETTPSFASATERCACIVDPDR